MKNFYESINEHLINFDKSIKIIFAGQSLNQAKETQVNLLRQRYYSNLTFLEYMAKTYGEMSFFKQTSLYVLSIGMSTTGVILVNPMFFIVGAISLNLLVFITMQYRALESRFAQLICDLEESEKRLETAVAANYELEAELRETSVQQDRLLEELEEGRLEVKRITQQVQESKRVVEGACEVIEKSAQKSHQIAEKLSEVEADTAQKGEQCIELLSQISEIVTKTLEDINHISENPMTKKLAEQDEYLTKLEAYLDETYADILESTDDQMLESGSSYSFFSRRSSESVVGAAGKNSLPI
jgi:hypothetical protein